LTLVAEVPVSDVTLTSTVPLPAGAVAVSEESELNVKAVAATDPNLTDVVPVNPLPKILTTVPPDWGPELGEIPETVVLYVNLSAELVVEVPAFVVTVTSTTPMPAGDTAVICDAPFTTTEVAAARPNLTPLAPMKPVPVMVTVSPPLALPVVGETAVTVGA
jgi:hypothetical protein